MKKTILLLFFCGFAIPAFSQKQAAKEPQAEQCGTMQNLERLKKQYPDIERQMAEYEKQIQEWIAKNPNSKIGSGQITVTIPTVIHVVWNTTAENISTTICNQIIQVLNDDNGRTNADTTQTPAIWKSIGAPTGAQFCLAQRDPSGAPTTGIERIQTAQTTFTTDDKIKFTAQGGADAWDPTRYFNIWVCDLTPGLGGYGEFPTGTASNTYGNVSDYTVVGTGQWVATHECGHCFNLFHIWGDDSGACTGSDAVADTPNQADASSGACATFPALDACSTVSPGYMFMNYMDYGANGCKNLFTQGQSARTNALLSTAPYSSWATSNGCTPVVLMSNDAGAPSVTTPNGMICALSFSPIVTIRNWGTNNLTSCNINYQIDSNPIQVYNWTGNLVSLATIQVTLPGMTTTAGTHSFTCYTTLPNTVTDGNPANDAANSTFNVIPVGQPTPFSYGFEPVAFPPTGWTLDNADLSITWARTTGAAKTGAASMWFNSIAYTCNGCFEIITLPNLDFTSLGSVQMTFQVAYRMLSDPTLTPNWSDSLRVDVSTDCGATWTNLYFKYSTALTTITPPFSTTAFVPGPNDWRLETLNLTPYAGNNNLLLRLKASSDYENNMYVDDINITGTIGIETIGLKNTMTVYPNPSGGNTTIEYSLPEASNVQFLLFDALGKEILNRNEGFVHRGTNKIILEEKSFTGNGIYYVQIKAGNIIETKKITRIN